MHLLAKSNIASVGFVLVWLVLGCQDPNQLNVVVPMVDTTSGLNIDEAELVEVKTVLLDSVKTSGVARMLAGFLQDPQIGNVGSRASFEIFPTLPAGGLTIRDLAVFDSLYINFDYDYVYGHTGEPITFDIFQLSDSIKAVDYFSFSQISYNNPQWGSFTINPTRNRQEGIVRHKVRFDSLGKRIMALSGRPELASTGAFIKEFKGFVIVPRPGSRGMIGFVNTPNLLVRLHYHVDNVSVAVLMTSPQVIYRNFSTYEKSGLIAPLAALTTYRDSLASSQTGGSVYVQPGAGLRALVSFPNLRAIKTRLGNDAIVKAELVIKPTDISTLRPPRFIRLSIVDAQNRILKSGGAERIIRNFSASAASNASDTYFAYDSLNQMYRIPFSTHLFSILQGAPNYKFVISNAETGSSVSRLIFNDFIKADGIRLRIYYLTQ